jgi:hypothetical protein
MYHVYRAVAWQRVDQISYIIFHSFKGFGVKSDFLNKLQTDCFRGSFGICHNWQPHTALKAWNIILGLQEIWKLNEFNKEVALFFQVLRNTILFMKVSEQ